MKKFACFAVAATLAANLAMPTTSEAAPIRFDAKGVTGISGYVTFDDSLFDGSSFQYLFNTAITDLSLNVFGELFDLSDVVTTSKTIIDSSGATPIIIEAWGNLADNGSRAIAFFPDEWNWLPSDGDATLGKGPTGGDPFHESDTYDFYPVNWEVAAVPLPASLPLLLGALGGVAVLRRRKKTA